MIHHWPPLREHTFMKPKHEGSSEVRKEKICN
jgi:hypothetical protein